MKAVKGIIGLFKDLLIRILPNFLVPKRFKKYHYCFLGHPRGYREIYRKFPFFKKVPKSFLRFLIRHVLWPITASEITGLKSLDDGHEIRGCVISVPMAAGEMLADRKRATRQMRVAVRHAAKQGVKIIGLAGYTASLSKGGFDLIDLGVDVTTGHAYTALNVVENYEAILKRLDIYEKKKDITLAVLGAAGSVGSTVSKYLASQGVKKIILVDLERKIDKVHLLRDEMVILNPEGDYAVTTDISSLKEAVVVFTATNASEALITPDRTAPGTIYIDDTQPTDISKEVHFQEDVLVLEAGAVRTPGVVTHFHFGLKHKEDNFCCMAELLALSATGHTGNYVINRANMDNILEMKALGQKLGFRVADFQNYHNTVTEESIDLVGDIVKSRIE